MNRALLALVAMLAITGNAFAQKGDLTLKSRSALIFDAQQGHAIYSKNIDTIMPIASITKLMTAMVVLDAQLPLSEEISIDSADIDVLKNTRSRLKVGSSLTRQQLLRLALMSSENRAAAALGRAYPGGIEAFVLAMNNKAFELGMGNSRFVDSTGLSSANVSTARDLVKMVEAAHFYGVIREFSTTTSHALDSPDYRQSLKSQWLFHRSLDSGTLQFRDLIYFHLSQLQSLRKNRSGGSDQNHQEIIQCSFLPHSVNAFDRLFHLQLELNTKKISHRYPYPR